jgi:hypothetical protein
MSFIPVGYLEAQAVFTGPGPGGVRMVVTGHTQVELASPDEEAEIIAEQIWSANGSDLRFPIDNNYSLVQVTVYANQGDPDLLIGQWTGTIQGTSSGTAVPPQVAVLIRKTTSMAGRWNRGRMYIPGVNSASLGEDGTLEGSALANWQNAANGFLQACSSTGLDLVILHNDPARTPTPVESLVVQSLSATQRRRLR